MPLQQFAMNPSALPFQTSPKRTINKPDWTITSDEVEQGCILWLGTPTEMIESQVRRGAQSTLVINAITRLPANQGMHEHPFLVLSRPESDPSKIYFLPMTSLGNQTLATKFTLRKASYHQSTFLPITPAEPHPLYLAGNPRYRTLTLENGDSLEKSTYVNVREVYEMDWRDAQLYWGSNPNLRKKWKLDASSMQAVLGLVSNNLKTDVGRQYIPAISPIAYSPQQRHTRARSQLLSPLNRRLATPTRSRTMPVYYPTTPPQPQPQPYIQRSPTSPITYAPRSYTPAIHPGFQSESSPQQQAFAYQRTQNFVQEQQAAHEQRQTLDHQRTERPLEAQQAAEERQPLLLSYNPQTPDGVNQSADDEISLHEGSSKCCPMFWWRLCW